MRITQWGEYGVHCCCYIAARHAAGHHTVSASEISEVQAIDILYAQQILQKLRRGGLVNSVRGPQGGYKLSRNPNEITLLDVLKVCEGDSFEIICESKPLDMERCNASRFCSLRPIWYKFKNHIDHFLSGYTIQDLVDSASEADVPVKIGGEHPAQSTALKPLP
ncbi:MAG: Rrf2 family transcriptional regulator [Deltaproteobacteria bacterium]|nr:Rrf2 family transcriptional regulator [Deltaproteobacteria bacterium]